MLILSIIFLIWARALNPVLISSILSNRIAILVLLYSSLLAWTPMYLEPIGVGVGVYGGLFQVTVLSQALDCLILGCASIILLLSSGHDYMAGEGGTGERYRSNSEPIPKGRGSDYPLIILFTTLGMISLVSSSDLLSMFLSIELQTLALYILATINRDSEAATSAGLKYFLLGALSSSFILLGSSLLYAFTGITSLEGVFMLCSMAVANTAIQLGILIIAIALLFKLAAAPFHNWAPDVYDGVPTIVTTWLAIMPKVAILGFLIDLQANTHLGVTQGASLWGNILIVSAMISLLIGGVVGLAQYRIKRLLAYSTISHMGFMLLALAIHSAEALEGLIFYLVQYVLTSTNIFFVLVAFCYFAPFRGPTAHGHKNVGGINDSSGRAPSQIITSSNALTRITPQSEHSLFPHPHNATSLRPLVNGVGWGVGRENKMAIIQIQSFPALGVTLAISLFSMAGIPPLLGFFGKMMVLYSATHSGYLLLATIAILVSLISAAYYLRVIRLLFFDTPQAKTMPPVKSVSKPISEGRANVGWLLRPFRASLSAESKACDVVVQERSDVSYSPRYVHNPPALWAPGPKGLGVAHALPFGHRGIAPRTPYLMVSGHLSMVIASITLFLIMFIAKPQPLLNSIHLLALSQMFW